MANTEHTELTAAERIALAKKVGARNIALEAAGSDAVHGTDAAADFLLRAAHSRNRRLGLESDTPEAAAQREAERVALIHAAIAATRSGS